MMETDAFKLYNISGSLNFELFDNELNLFNIDEISRSYHSVLRSYLGAYTEIVLDMKKVRMIDSSALAFLVRASLLSKKNKKAFILKNLNESARKTLEYANLAKEFEIF